MNPYSGNDFFHFFATLFHRLTGKLPLESLPSDEIQLLVLIGVSLSSALIGVFLILKKMSMLANALSHTVLLGIVITSYFFFSLAFELDLKTLFIASLISAALTAFLTQLMTERMRLQEDASIGLVFTTLFALGVTAVTIFTRNTHLSTEAIMGNADALHIDDIQLTWCVAGVDLLIILLFFKEFALTSFDSALAKALGISASIYHSLLMLLTAATCISAFRAVGVLLVLAFLVGPPLTARLWTNHLKPLLLLSSLFGALSALIGVALSRHFLSCYNMPLSTGGMVVTIIGLLYFTSALIYLTRRHTLRDLNV
jgi:manganese/zinc/iron transport system permease protein